jgi:preprotein translocase SecE subunit
MIRIFRNIILLPKSTLEFINQVIFELRQVEWLSRIKVFRYTLLTLFILLFGAIFVLLVDRGFLEVRNLIF